MERCVVLLTEKKFVENSRFGAAIMGLFGRSRPDFPEERAASTCVCLPNFVRIGSGVLELFPKNRL